MKPHPHLLRQNAFRSSTAAPLCMRSVERHGRLVPRSAAQGGGRALLIPIAVAGFLWLTVSAETVAVFAQADVASSTVKGKVMDQAGAGVSQALVTVMDPERGVVRSVRTDGEGGYPGPRVSHPRHPTAGR